VEIASVLASLVATLFVFLTHREVSAIEFA
jgi:hypothetical protein